MTVKRTGNSGSERRGSSAPRFPSINGYRFLQTIARSPKSEVHVAYSVELAENVAVKVLRTGPHSSADPGEEERFERERVLLTQLRNPAIIDIYDWGHDADFRYIVTEYFPSGSLELRIRNLMTVADSVDIFLQIAGALGAVHGANLCHRDLKPANVMMRPDGRIVLIDFGLAKSVASCGELSGEVRGSPYYISPEQAEGAAVDQRSDLYSLGIIFYEMLTGQRPFRGNSVVAIIQAHRSAPIPTLSEDLRRFQPLLNGLLAKEPAQRLASTTAALEQLAKLKV